MLKHTAQVSTEDVTQVRRAFRPNGSGPLPLYSDLLRAEARRPSRSLGTPCTVSKLARFSYVLRALTSIPHTFYTVRDVALP